MIRRSVRIFHLQFYDYYANKEWKRNVLKINSDLKQNTTTTDASVEFNSDVV